MSLLVPYSVQVFEFNTAKSASAIKDLLESKKRKQGQNYPQILKVSESRGIVSSSLKIWKGEELMFYEIAIKPRENILIIQGRGDGRGNVGTFLAEVIENDTRYNVISEHVIEVPQMISLFENIVSENSRNIITLLKVTFEPRRGFEYARETYTELSYKFVENRCASKHKDFKKLCKNGKRMNMSLGLIQCTGIVEEPRNVGIRLDVNPNCSFRMYSEIPAEDWNKFCFNMLNFL